MKNNQNSTKVAPTHQLNKHFSAPFFPRESTIILNFRLMRTLRSSFHISRTAINSQLERNRAALDAEICPSLLVYARNILHECRDTSSSFSILFLHSVGCFLFPSFFYRPNVRNLFFCESRYEYIFLNQSRINIVYMGFFR